jgi:hypothetical protein
VESRSTQAVSLFPPRLEFDVSPFGPCLNFGACDLELAFDLVLVIWNLP